MSTIAELAVPYAMLALHDDNVDINVPMRWCMPDADTAM